MRKKQISMALAAVFIFSAILGAQPVTVTAGTTEGYASVINLVDAVGTYFEITNSTYLNITLTSTETIHLFLEVGLRTVSFVIESNSSATSTDLTLSGFEPNSTYYRYEDGDLMASFTTDSTGGYSYTQDISESHHVVIQENVSTMILYNDYTFKHDIYEPIIVAADNIVIDGNGYTLQGPGNEGYGFYLGRRWGVTIKNTVIKMFWDGIHLWECFNNTIEGNTISVANAGIHTADSDSNTIVGNTISNNAAGIFLYHSSDNWIERNTISNNVIGAWLYGSTRNTIVGNTISDSSMPGITLWSSDNTIYHNNFIDNHPQAENIWGAVNTWDDGYPSGGNYWSDYTIKYPDAQELDDSGIWDTPYVIDEDNRDNYPLVEPWIPPSPPEALAETIQTVESWDLTDGVENALTSKLEDAITLLDKGNINGATHKLQDLIKKVTYDATHLTQEQKDYIIQTTQEIIDLIR